MKKFLKSILIIVLYIAIVFIILLKTNTIKIFEKHKTIDEYIDNGLSLEDPTIKAIKEKEDKFYYNQLDKNAQIIYDKMLEAKEELQNGRIDIKFNNNEFDTILSEENGMGILSERFQDAVDAIRYDHMELFYVDFTKIVLKTITYTKGNDISYEVYLTLADNEENCLQDELENENINQIQKEIEYVSDQILENVTGTDYQKIQQVHNWLIDNLQYDTTYTLENNRNIYGALINKNVVCEGYAKAFKYLLDEMKIPCIIVSGDAINSTGATESHMWNYVKINDIWYAFDVTWDDPIMDDCNELPDEYRYKYFCQGENINSNHFPKSTITNGGKEFNYPKLYNKE